MQTGNKFLETAKEVALSNMVRLHIAPECIAAFRDKQRIWCSERQIIRVNGIMKPVACGTLYDAEQTGYTYHDKVMLAVSRVKQDGYLPYHVVQANTTFGNLFSVLYTGGDESLLITAEDYDETYGYSVSSYVYNADDDMLSEYGYIYVRPTLGGVLRTA